MDIIKSENEEKDIYGKKNPSKIFGALSNFFAGFLKVITVSVLFSEHFYRIYLRFLQNPKIL